MILDLKGIYKDYQQGKMTVPVLKDVDFSMEERSEERRVGKECRSRWSPYD